MVVEAFYTSNEYLIKNPGWHVDASPWKTKGILEMMERNHLTPQTICEVGCGAGEILRLMQQQMNDDCTFVGYDIASQAIDLAKTRENEQLHFRLADFLQEDDAHFDLLLLVDVLEHFENIFQVLRDIKSRSEYKILQLPLDISVVSVLRNELIDFRHATGHLHFFTKDVILETLRDNGYEVIDCFYKRQPLETTSWSTIKTHPRKLLIKVLKLLKRGFQRLPGSLLYLINKDVAVRIFGGWKLVVLAK